MPFVPFMSPPRAWMHTKLPSIGVIFPHSLSLTNLNKNTNNHPRTKQIMGTKKGDAVASPFFVSITALYAVCMSTVIRCPKWA